MDYTSFAPGASSNKKIPNLSLPELPTPHRRHLPKLVGLIILILLVGGTASGAMWYWQNYQSTYDDVIPMFTPRIAKDATADWKTYTNTKYGFEFKYPLIDSVKILTANSGYTDREVLWEAVDANNDNNDNTQLWMGLAGYLQLFTTTHNLILPPITQHSITIDGVTATKLYVCSVGPESSGMCGWTYKIPIQKISLIFYAAGCSTLVEIPESQCIPDKAGKIYEDALLSTFRFVDLSNVPGEGGVPLDSNMPQ